MFGRRKIAMIVAEFLGAFILSASVYSMVVRTSFPFFSGLVAGSVLAMLVLAVGSISGAHANPAVTLGLWSLRKVRATQAVVYVAAQMLGGVVAIILMQYLIGHSLSNEADKFEWKVLVAEAIGALIFCFGIAAAVYQEYKGAKLALTAGVSLAIGIVVASLASNAVINPAVAIGIRSWNWAYAIGPVIGGVIGMNLYGLLFYPVLSSKTSNKSKTQNKSSKSKS